MPKKRKSRGRRKGSKGKVPRVQCSMCGQLIPRDKAKKVTVTRYLVPKDLAKELKDQGAYVGMQQVVKYYCVNCAVFHGIVKIRPEEERKLPAPITKK
ncbi:MAG: 30S ribosomal protein S26e [Candidatus Bathyarchaeia archaeon]|nr:30S ribosomal protein S26e [Candidatus Jordarchaeia archaeon]